MRIYRVSFLVKKGGDTNYICDVYAPNKKSAIEIVSEKWYENHIAHAFHLNAEKIDKFEYDGLYRLREY